LMIYFAAAVGQYNVKFQAVPFLSQAGFTITVTVSLLPDTLSDFVAEPLIHPVSSKVAPPYFTIIRSLIEYI